MRKQIRNEATVEDFIDKRDYRERPNTTSEEIAKYYDVFDKHLEISDRRVYSGIVNGYWKS